MKGNPVLMELGGPSTSSITEGRVLRPCWCMGSAAAGRVSTIDANRDLLIACLEHVAPLPALVVGNSMGGLVAMAAAATGTDAIDRLVLVDPAVPPTGLASLNRTTLLSIALPSLPLAGC